MEAALGRSGRPLGMLWNFSPVRVVSLRFCFGREPFRCVTDRPLGLSLGRTAGGLLCADRETEELSFTAVAVLYHRPVMMVFICTPSWVHRWLGWEGWLLLFKGVSWAVMTS